MTLTLPRGEAAVAAVLIALAVYVLWEAEHMPASTPGQPGAGFFPAILAVILLICAGGILISSWSSGKDAAAPTVIIGHSKVWITLASLVALTFALEPLGFVLAASAFLFVLLRFCGGVNWLAAGIGAITLTLAAWYFFTAALGVALPHGVLPL